MGPARSKEIYMSKWMMSHWGSRQRSKTVVIGARYSTVTRRMGFVTETITPSTVGGCQRGGRVQNRVLRAGLTGYAAYVNAAGKDRNNPDPDRAPAAPHAASLSLNLNSASYCIYAPELVYGEQTEPPGRVNKPRSGPRTKESTIVALSSHSLSLGAMVFPRA